jgi:cullin 3
MSSGLDSMIDLDRIDDLARMYTLFIMVPTGLPELCRALRKSIVRRGKEINQNALGPDTEGSAQGVMEASNEKDDAKGKAKGGNAAQGLAVALKWVQDVLDLKDKFEDIWRQAFKNNREIEGTYTEVRCVPGNVALACLSSIF